MIAERKSENNCKMSNHRSSNALSLTSAAVHDVQKAIANREASLARLRSLECNGSKQASFRSLGKSLADELSMCVLAYRESSLRVVESLAVWKQHITESTRASVKPVWICNDTGENYLKRLFSDTEWLRTSALSKLFSFSDKADPFLIEPSAPNHSRRVPMTRSQLERIRAAERILIEEINNVITEEIVIIESVRAPQFTSALSVSGIGLKLSVKNPPKSKKKVENPAPQLPPPDNSKIETNDNLNTELTIRPLIFTDLEKLEGFFVQLTSRPDIFSDLKRESMESADAINGLRWFYITLGSHAEVDDFSKMVSLFVYRKNKTIEIVYLWCKQGSERIALNEIVNSLVVQNESAIRLFLRHGDDAIKVEDPAIDLAAKELGFRWFRLSNQAGKGLTILNYRLDITEKPPVVQHPNRQGYISFEFAESDLLSMKDTDNNESEDSSISVGNPIAIAFAVNQLLVGDRNTSNINHKVIQDISKRLDNNVLSAIVTVREGKTDRLDQLIPESLNKLSKSNPFDDLPVIVSTMQFTVWSPLAPFPSEQHESFQMSTVPLHSIKYCADGSPIYLFRCELLHGGDERSDPNDVLAFIMPVPQGLSSPDVFSFTAKQLNSGFEMNPGSRESLNDEQQYLSFPLFNMRSVKVTDALRGVQIKDKYVDKCCEMTKMDMRAGEFPEGFIPMIKKETITIQEDFIYGIWLSSLDELDVPLIACLIAKDSFKSH